MHDTSHARLWGGGSGVRTDLPTFSEIVPEMRNPRLIVYARLCIHGEKRLGTADPMNGQTVNDDAHVVHLEMSYSRAYAVLSHVYRMFAYMYVVSGIDFSQSINN